MPLSRRSGVGGRILPATVLSAQLRPHLCLTIARHRSSAPISYRCRRPNAENDDHHPPRIASRNLFDVSVGDDNLFKGDHYKWSLTLTAINVTNKLALYNFLSTFSGTHYVTPRALTAQIGFHF